MDSTQTLTGTTIGYNGKVLCTPFERKGVEASVNSAFATAKHKTVLVRAGHHYLAKAARH